MSVKYLILLKLETTCFPNQYELHNGWFPEIIEFGAILLNLQTAQIEQRFHRGIRPTQYSQLSDQCQLVTNITQNMIQGRPTISMVLDDFDDCLRKFCTTNSVLFPKANVFEENRDYVIFCTWSDSDLGHILPNECLQKNINYGDYLKYWIDGQRIVALTCEKTPLNVEATAKFMNTPIVGRAHTALEQSEMLSYIIVQIYQRFSNLFYFFHNCT